MSGRSGSLMLCWALAGCGQSGLTEVDRAAIEQVLERQAQAWNEGDIDGFMRGYHRRPDIVFTSGGTIRRGFDATLAAYRKKYVSGDNMGHLDFRELEVEQTGPDSAVVLGHWELTQTEVAGRGVFTLVFVRDKGRWGIIHDHTSQGS